MVQHNLVGAGGNRPGAHRIGQTQSLWVVKLVAQGTIEERKQPLFSENDLAELLKPLSK